MKKLFLLPLLVLSGLQLIAQDTTVTIYFKSGQSVLTPSQQKSIDKLQVKPVTKITFDGYADTVGKAVFNKKLSYKRAETTAKLAKNTNKTIVGNGESKEKKVSLNTMRKVVVKVWYDKPVVEEKVIVKEIAKPIDPCTEDTILVFENGSKVKMNKCYYLKIKDCFRYKEYFSATSVQQAGLTTVDQNDNPIESSGMIDIGFCADTCNKKPIIVYMPVPKCMGKQPMTLWTYRGNAWVNTKNKLDFVTIEGKEYYKIEVYCPGKLNCDRPRPSKGKKVRVKLKKGMKYKSATLSYDCPLYSVKAKYRKNRTVAVFPYVCQKANPLFYAKVYTKSGDTLVINNQNINQFKKRGRFNNSCKCGIGEKEKALVVFNIRKKYLYRRYKLYKKDFTTTN